MDLSDEEKHAIELRRERSNKISKYMGEYLLKGYKMLDATCNRCGTILMRDRQKNDYCVACNDIDGLQDANSQNATRLRVTDEMHLNEERSQATRTENMDTAERHTNSLKFWLQTWRQFLKDLQEYSWKTGECMKSASN